VLRRPFALIFTSAVLGMLAAHPAQASTMASFRLTNTDPAGSGDSPVMTVLASIVPPGSVTPPDPSTSPLTILAGSSGFNPDDLKVSLGDGTTPSGDPFQALALDFGPGGLAPGGRLYFSLNLAASSDGVVNLILPSSINNLAVSSYVPPPGVTPIDGGQGNVPEPISLVLWTGLATFGVIRARIYRRSRVV
jgi:hypothetical protein